jgi:hypothetical protein
MRRTVKRVTRISTTTTWTVAWEAEVPPGADGAAPGRDARPALPASKEMIDQDATDSQPQADAASLPEPSDTPKGIEKP